MTARHVLVDTDGDIATITLDQPEKRNALALDVMLELTEAFQQVGRSEALGVVLAANGPVFSAGHNFGDMAGASIDDARHLFAVCTTLMDTVQAIPQPVVARVHALATAAGCQLVATCDLAVAAQSASFAIPGGKGGLFCHTPLVAVARNIGRKRALEMALTGDPIDASVAAEWGLINRAVPDDELDAAVHDLITRATRGSAWSKALGKRGFYEQIGADQPSAYAVAAERMAQAAMELDAQEAFAAFLDKRHASFVQGPNDGRRRPSADRRHAASTAARMCDTARSRWLRIVRVVTPRSAATTLDDSLRRRSRISWRSASGTPCWRAARITSARRSNGVPCGPAGRSSSRSIGTIFSVADSRRNGRWNA